MFNLVENCWIPVKMKDGSNELIRPFDVTKNLSSNPIVSLYACRPDFNGGLIQFLVGLVQTSMTPKNSEEWNNYFHNPPSTSLLKFNFSKLKYAFNLDGEFPRFMQEGNLENNSRKTINFLLIDSPGENTINKNTDLFVKRNQYLMQCYPCTATALFCLNTFAPSGGSGHRTSIRGGGPLTTVIFDPESLWKTIWLNIIPEDKWPKTNWKLDSHLDAHIFPWLKFKKTLLQPEEIHPLQMYWGLPRRILLDFQLESYGTCQLCGTQNQKLVKHFFTAKHGYHYKNFPLPHVLSPYIKKSNKEIFPKKSPVNDNSYRQWLGLIFKDTKLNVNPAFAVTTFLHEKPRFPSIRLWSFGFVMNNMKPLNWKDWEIPLLIPSKEYIATFKSFISQLILAADHIATIIFSKLNHSWKLDSSQPNQEIDNQIKYFWYSTEFYFYKLLNKALILLPDDSNLNFLKLDWLKAINQTTEKLFQIHFSKSLFRKKDLRKESIIWKNLMWYASEKNPKLRKILLLPDNIEKNYTLNFLR